MKYKSLMGVFAVTLLSVSPVRAWHNQGHMMTAAVAWENMTPGAVCRAELLLNRNGEYLRGLQNPGNIRAAEAQFVNAATWPDRIKAQGSGFRGDGDDADAVGENARLNVGLDDHLMHKYWHFIDYAIPADGSRMPPTVNAVERVNLFLSVIADQNSSDDLKAYDLAWLIHLVGDLHQPLHTTAQYGRVFGGGSDAGGNAVMVKASGAEELHGFWDAAPGDSRNGGKVLSISIAAARALPAPDPQLANVRDPAAWSRESYDLAARYEFAAPVTMNSKGPFTLTDGYIGDAQRIAKLQVALGGIRLASLLNKTLTWPAPACAAGGRSVRHRRSRLS